MNSKNTEITIIGSGIIGICCALKLQLQGHKVCLLDKESPVNGCSKGNAGHFATEQIFPISNPSILKQLPAILMNPTGPLSINPTYLAKITPWLVRFLLSSRSKQFSKGTQMLSQLNKQAMKAYEPLIEAANAQHLIKKDGYLLAFEGKNASKLAHIESKKLKLFNIRQQVIEKDNLLSLEPNLINCESALYFPDVSYSTNPEKLTMQLFDCFVKNGGEFIQANVKDITTQENTIQLHTSINKFDVKKLIICAGIFSKKLVGKLGIKIPLDTERGYHLMLSQHGLLSRPVAFAQRKFIITPMLSGTRLAGTVEFAGTKIKPNWKRADMLFKQAKKVLNKVDESKIGEKWMGFRPSFPDSLPVIDRSPDNKNILFAFGHQHLGLTQGAITAELIADLVADKKPKFNLNSLSITRF